MTFRIFEQILQCFNPLEAYFWKTHSGSEIDLFFLHQGQRPGFEIQFNEAPSVSRSMKAALGDRMLDHLWVVYPGPNRCPVEEKLTVLPLADVPTIL